MDLIPDAAELVRKFRAFAFDGGAPEEIALRLQTIPGTDADLLTGAPEILYAHYDLLDDRGKRILGEMFVYGNEQNWTTFAGGPKGSGNRAETIVGVVSRDLGDEGAILPPPSEEWPAPKAELRDGADWRSAADEPDADPA